MAVAANICVAWPAAVGSIPAGWTRETTLDGRYILGASPGADTDLVTDRGNTTHTHTSPSHTPTQNAHTHTFSAADGSGSSPTLSGTVSGSASDAGHGHPVATTAAATATNNGVAISVDPASNDLAFLEVIWIKSDGSPATFPANCIAFFASDSLPSGWSRVQADTYLKGAGSGADGGTSGGSNTHLHTSPAHTHTQNAHTHANSTSGGGDTAAVGKGTGTDILATTIHTHTVSFDAATPTNQSVTTVLGTTSGEPPFQKLNTVQTASPSLPTGIVALWLGTNAGIPANWVRLTTMDGLFLRGAAVDGESGVVTGGSTQHTHTASSCQPVQNSHTHTSNDLGASASVTAASGTHANFELFTHSHPWDVSTDVATNNSVAVSINLNTANSAFPKHRTVIYVQFQGTPKSGILTTYDTGIFPGVGMNLERIAPKLTPEQEQAIWRGDIRHYPGALPGGTPR